MAPFQDLGLVRLNSNWTHATHFLTSWGLRAWPTSQGPPKLQLPLLPGAGPVVIGRPPSQAEDLRPEKLSSREGCGSSFSALISGSGSLPSAKEVSLRRTGLDAGQAETVPKQMPPCVVQNQLGHLPPNTPYPRDCLWEVAASVTCEIRSNSMKTFCR